MDHLIRRGHSWYVRVAVPQRLREAIGKREFLIALRTRDLATARRLSHAQLAAITAQLQAAEAHRTFPKDSAEYILQAAKDARAAVINGVQTEHDAEVALDVTVDQHLELLGRNLRVDPEGDPKLTEGHAQAIKLAHRVFKGETVALLSHQVDQYLAEVTPAVRAQTMQDKHRVYGALQAWLGTDREVSTITRKLAGSYVSTHLAKQGRAPKTLRSELAQLSALWKYMVGRGVAETNVWSLMSATLPTSKRGGVRTHRRPWTEQELVRLFKETETGDPIWSVAALSLYSGCRIEEICQLRVSDVKDDALHVRVTKSEAGVRSVPVHPAIKPLVEQLTATSHDGYIVPGLLVAGRDAKRSVYLSKSAAWHLRKVLKITDRNLVVHGL